MSRTSEETRKLTNTLYTLVSIARDEKDVEKKRACMVEAKKFADEHKLPFHWSVTPEQNNDDEDYEDSEEEYEDSDYDSSEC